MPQNTPPSIRDLYPNLPNDELAEAEDNLKAYLKLVLRIFDRLELSTDRQVEPLAPDLGTLSLPSPDDPPRQGNLRPT